MNSFFKILVLGSKNSGKSSLIKSFKNYFLHNNVVALISFYEPVNKFDMSRIIKYDLVMYVIDKEYLMKDNNLDYVSYQLNFLSKLLGNEKNKLILIINKWNNANIMLHSHVNYKTFRCSSIKICLEHKLKSNNKLDHLLKAKGIKDLDFSDYDTNVCEIYGDWDNLIKHIIINYINKKGFLSKL